MIWFTKKDSFSLLRCFAKYVYPGFSLCENQIKSHWGTFYKRTGQQSSSIKLCPFFIKFISVIISGDTIVNGVFSDIMSCDWLFFLLMKAFDFWILVFCFAILLHYIMFKLVYHWFSRTGLSSGIVTSQVYGVGLISIKHFNNQKMKVALRFVQMSYNICKRYFISLLVLLDC